MTISTHRKATALVLVILMAAMVLVIPQTSRAAFDDVSLASSVVIGVGAINLTIAGSADVVESLAVTGTTVSFIMQAGSTVKIESADSYTLAHDAPNGFAQSTRCLSSLSDLTLTAPSGASQTTVTVTPSATGCDSAGGAGGGGAAPTPTSTSTSTTATTTTATSPTVTVTTPASNEASVRAQLQAQLNALMAQLNALMGKPNANAQANASANASFNRDLQVGSTGEDVMALQVWLNAKGYMVAESGAGSLGNETMKFGKATKAALMKYQKAVGISPASGYFGPKTRAYIEMHP